MLPAARPLRLRLLAELVDLADLVALQALGSDGSGPVSRQPAHLPLLRHSPLLLQLHVHPPNHLRLHSSRVSYHSPLKGHLFCGFAAAQGRHELEVSAQSARALLFSAEAAGVGGVGVVVGTQRGAAEFEAVADFPRNCR